MSPLTPEQAAAARAPERSVAVAAGAGTGKTRVITARYLHLVLDLGAAPARILAVTFTEKAAREMKDRIRAALAEAGRPDLARAAEFAPISTMHAFLARVLRERALDAGVDPRFQLADETVAERLLEESLVGTVEALPEEARALLADLAGAEDALLDLYLAARATPHAMRDLRPVDLDEPSFRARLERFLGACAERRGGGAAAARAEGLVALGPRLLALDPGAAAEFDALVKGGRGEPFAEGRALRDAYAPLAHRDRARAVGAAVVDALARLDEAFAARKRAEGLLDFADLERIGLALLRSPAGEEVAADFDHLLVDEYQDTSRIQEAILERLAERCVRFGVGDEKQSIYRFRHADAQVFADLRARASSYPLGGSFRARPELVGFTNALFRALFEGTGVAPQDLRAEATFSEGGGVRVEFLAPEGENGPAARRKEATLLARRLREIVEEERPSLSRAGREGTPLRYAHCALLLRATTHLSVYERALAAAGVPYVVVKGRGYYAAREVVDLAHLLLLLDDPLDDYRAVAALTSLLCGLTEADLLRLRGDGPILLRDAAALPEASRARLAAFRERFARWRALFAFGDTGELVESILRDTRFPELLLVEPDGRRRHANLQKALRRARASGEDPATFARALLDFRERERRESEAPIASESDDAVKVMTVHAAKGLEFPLVAVADLLAPQRAGGRALLRPDGVFGFRLRADDGNVDPPGFAELQAWDAAQEEGERRRLLYVALTRAEEFLVLSGGAHPRADRLLLGALPRGVPVVAPKSVPPLARPPGWAAAVRGAIRRRAPLPPELPRDAAGARALLARVDSLARPEPDATPYVAAAADLLEFARCPRRYRLARMLGIEVEPPEEEGEHEEHSRRTLGTALHALLAKLGPGAGPDEAQIREELPRATAADVARIRRWCAWLARQAWVRRVAGLEQRREMPFLARIAGLAVRGVIDLYVPGAPLLADYKTSRAARGEEYAPQMSVYLAAVRALGLPAPPVAHLLYVDAEEVVEVRETPLEGLVARFREAHRGAGRFPPTPGPLCRLCEFRPACVAEGVACP